MIRIFTLLMSLVTISLYSVKAQNYSSDAILLNSNGSIVTIRSSGTADKKKDAAEMAIKSAFYAYLVSGIDGLNDGKPLLGKNLSTDAQSYLEGILGGRYSVFMKGYTVDEKASKVVGRTFQITVSVDIYEASLKRDMANNKVAGNDPANMSLNETQEQITIPSIMVVPYCAGSETFEDVIQNNQDVRMAVSKIQTAFITQGVEVEDIEQALKNASTYQARQGDLSLNDVIINNATANVMVYVDMKKDITNEGVKVTLILRATEVANKKVIASTSEVSGRKNTIPEAVCAALAEYIAPGFLKQISTAMARKISTGNAISVTFTIDPQSSVNMDSRLESQNLPLSDLLILWIRKNAQNGKYRQQGRSNTLLTLSEILITNKDANGNEMDINSFGLELYLYLTDKLGLNIERDVVGNSLSILIK